LLKALPLEGQAPTPALPRMRGREGPVAQRWEGRGDPTLGAALVSAAKAFEEAGLDEPRRHARRLLATALGLSAAQVFAYPERRLSEVQQAQVDEMLRRAVAGEPLSRIAGRREFWGLEFGLSADTLDPRPETETVVEAVLARLPDRGGSYRFLDLGTGTGCLILALLSEYPQATGVGIDVAAGAARAARRNAQLLRLDQRAGFAAGDWGRPLAGPFDAVIANPPYIASAAIEDLPPAVREYDPRRALDGGADGLAAYRAIAADLSRLLSPEGLFAAEIGAGQAASVAAILTGTGLFVDGIVRDLAGIERCIVARRERPVPAQKKIGKQRRPL
jgi:release factor glutamine methyltransferase